MSAYSAYSSLVSIAGLFLELLVDRVDCDDCPKDISRKARRCCAVGSCEMASLSEGVYGQSYVASLWKREDWVQDISPRWESGVAVAKDCSIFLGVYELSGGKGLLFNELCYSGGGFRWIGMDYVRFHWKHWLSVCPENIVAVCRFIENWWILDNSAESDRFSMNINFHVFIFHPLTLVTLVSWTNLCLFTLVTHLNRFCKACENQWNATKFRWNSTSTCRLPSPHRCDASLFC